MPFFRPLKAAAPEAAPDLSWPINGMAYVIAFLGPLSAGPMLGLLCRDWRVLTIGLLVGIGITLFNAWLSDRFLDRLIARFQRPLQKRIPNLFANVAAYAMATVLCALSLFAPLFYFRQRRSLPGSLTRKERLGGENCAKSNADALIFRYFLHQLHPSCLQPLNKQFRHLLHERVPVGWVLFTIIPQLSRGE